MEPTIYKPSIYKGAGIYKTGAEGGYSPLPKEYEQVNFLKKELGANTSILNPTGTFQMQASDYVELSFALYTNDNVDGSSYGIFYIGSSYNVCEFSVYTRSFVCRWGDGNTWYTNTNLTSGVEKEFTATLRQGTFVVNGVTVGVGTGNISPNKIYQLCGGNEHIYTKMFSIKVFNSADTLKFEFIPCKRKLDDNPGLYEIFTNTFIGAGSGFSCG